MIPHKVAALSCCLLLFSSVAACREKNAPTADILIKVDHRTVTIEQFRREFEQTVPLDQQQQTGEREELERSFLAQVIDRQLALAEVERLGIQVTANEVEAALEEHRRDYPEGGFEQNLQERKVTLDQWRRELRERMLMERLAKQVTKDMVKVSDADISSYYRANREEFERPAQVRARQIVVADEAEGEKVLALLHQKQPFADVAREYSLSPDAAQGGDLGFFARGEMPAEFDAVVFNLPLGKLSPLVKSEYGYHIFLVEERREPVKLSLAQAREEIREKLFLEQEEQAYRSWLDGLRSKAKIEVDWALLGKK